MHLLCARSCTQLRMCIEVVCSLVATVRDVKQKNGNTCLCFRLWTRRAHFEANKGNYSCIHVGLFGEGALKINLYLTKGSGHMWSSKGNKGSETLQKFHLYSTFMSFPGLTVSLHLKTLQPCKMHHTK